MTEKSVGFLSQCECATEIEDEEPFLADQRGIIVR